MGSSYGANPSRAVETIVGPGKAKVRLVSGSTGACVFNVEGPQAIGSGCNRTSAVVAGDSWTADTIPYGPGGARTKVLLGAAPDGNATVTISWADGGATVVPVTDNVYCVPLGSHTGWKWVTLEDSRATWWAPGMPRLP